ncbi:SatD family protein [Clostridium polynesiense]|uniref:SatD family protein n=1 Tax=Clostridium polynesiense TaxID=1325933 RepID=UPI0005910C49|nr:SatD family protein [Clostridium polynesiense]
MLFFFSYDPYIAIIGDIKKSKKLEYRKTVQESLKEALDNINNKFQQDISSKFIITLGDEFQGLLSSGNNVMDIIEEIRRDMYPVEIRFGIGVGAITTSIDSERAIGADGPAYYLARKAVELLKENEQKNKTSAADIRIETDGDNDAAAAMLNTILSLLTVIKRSWTDRQREIIWDVMRHQDGQVKSAERLNIAQSSVQRGLTKGNYYAYKEATDTINEILKEIRRKDV